MVTVREPLIWRGERLEPGVDRFAPEHGLVCAHPEFFTPAYSRDRETLVRLRSLTEARYRDAVRVRRSPSWRLPTAQATEKTWELR
jgi:hypothetical protein